MQSTVSDSNAFFHPSYVGRFAPSPSGPLHFGSLVCALASFLHARQANGRWLIRIEDIDTPRIDSAMSPVILESLAAHGMQSDGEVLYQSQRHALYARYLHHLKGQNAIYACQCSRREIKARADYYDRQCRNKALDFAEHAIRWKNDEGLAAFEDLHFGSVTLDASQKHIIRLAKEDPVLKRADGIYAYHLVVVADDIEQGITHIVRGADLIDTAPLHQMLHTALQNTLNVERTDMTAPQYLHIPVAADKPGQKLSKQHHAAPIDDAKALSNLKSALDFLNCDAERFKHISSVGALIEWAIENFDFESLPEQTEILVSERNGVYCRQNTMNF